MGTGALNGTSAEFDSSQEICMKDELIATVFRILFMEHKLWSMDWKMEVS